MSSYKPQVQTVGDDKFYGNALAFDNTDRPVVHVSLNDIYGLAEAAFGAIPTDASY